jgi:hypothetical protein
MTRFPTKRFAQSLLASSLLVTLAAWAAAATYPTPDAASEALVTALRAHDQPALAKVLGDDWRTYIPTDGVDRDDVDAFVADYDSSHKIVTEGNTDHLAVGSAGWVLPIPLVKGASGWSFDTKAGHDEIIAQQIGHNESSVPQALLAYYDAQRDYASSVHDQDAVPHYASRLISTPGKHDGLYWEPQEGSPESPLGPYFVTPPTGGGYYGYHYRILTAQGPSAPGGAYNYMEGKVLANGFALIAWPVRYGETGVMSFEISHDGQVFEKNLGKDTEHAAASITRFDPDSSWTEVPADATTAAADTQ